MDFQELYNVAQVAIVPVLIGVIALLKSVIPDKWHKYMGLVAWGLGIAASLTYGSSQNWTIWQCVMVGSAVGLSAAGFYSTQKNARE